MVGARRVSFVGPGVAGRRESLSYVLRRVGPSTGPVFDNLDRTLTFGGAPLVAAVASKRSLFSDASHPDVVEELGRLVRSSAFVFVVDSQAERIEVGLEQLSLLRTDLARCAI